MNLKIKNTLKDELYTYHVPIDYMNVRVPWRPLLLALICRLIDKVYLKLLFEK